MNKEEIINYVQSCIIKLQEYIDITNCDDDKNLEIALVKLSECVFWLENSLGEDYE